MSPSKKLQRQQPSSHFKIKYVSPASRIKRKQAVQRERSADKVKLAKYDHLDITLDDDQSDELCGVIERIEDQCHDELGKLFGEADAKSRCTGETLRHIWQSDKPAKSEFFKDQQCNSKHKQYFLKLNL